MIPVDSSTADCPPDGFSSTVVNKAYRGEVTGRYVVIFDKDMLALYEAGYTLIDWQQHMALGQNNLAKWLHGFYSIHAAPFAYKVETLRGLCSSTAELKKFKQALKKALVDLADVGAIESWAIDSDDLVQIERKPSPSQRKHLTKAKAAKRQRI